MGSRIATFIMISSLVIAAYYAYPVILIVANQLAR